MSIVSIPLARMRAAMLFIAATAGIPSAYNRAFPADQIGTSKRNGGSVARDKRAARKARNAKRHKRASK